MDINEAVRLFGLLSLSDGTQEFAERNRRLTEQLLTNPDGFMDEYIDSIDEMYSQRAAQSLHELTGQCTVVPNLAELHELLRARAMKQKGGNAE